MTPSQERVGTLHSVIQAKAGIHLLWRRNLEIEMDPGFRRDDEVEVPRYTARGSNANSSAISSYSFFCSSVSAFGACTSSVTI